MYLSSQNIDLIGFSVSLSIITILNWMKQNKKHNSKFSPSKNIEFEQSLRINLSDVENMPIMRELLSTSAISFYNGPDISQYLHKKVIDIIQCNPWLNGTLIEFSEGRFQIAYESPLSFTQFQIKKSLFTNVKDLFLDENMEYVELFKHVQPFLVKKAKYCLHNKQEALFRITYIQIKHDKFAIVCSTSHNICDGFDFYNLFGMLSSTVPAIELQAERVNCSDEINQLVDSKYTYEFFNWLGAFPSYFRMIFSKLFRKPHKIGRFLVNKTWVEHEKMRARLLPPEVQYVTTNDVLCSYIFQQCQAGVGTIAFNYRNRVPSLHSNHVGNYSQLMALQKEDFSEPCYIRRSLQVYHSMHNKEYPGFWASFRSPFMIITNWTGFHQDAVFDNCTLIEHLPLKDRDGHTCDTYCVIYKKTFKETGVLLFSRDVDIVRLSQQPAFCSA